MSIDPNRHDFNWGGREKILFECYWRPMDRLKVGETVTKTGLLSSIGWSGGNVDEKMACLFWETGVGAPNEDFYLGAKLTYSDYNLQDLDEWFIRKCSYFTHLKIDIRIIDLMHLNHFQNLFFS